MLFHLLDQLARLLLRHEPKCPGNGNLSLDRQQGIEQSWLEHLRPVLDRYAHAMPFLVAAKGQPVGRPGQRIVDKHGVEVEGNGRNLDITPGVCRATAVMQKSDQRGRRQGHKADRVHGFGEGADPRAMRQQAIQKRLAVIDVSVAPGERAPGSGRQGRRHRDTCLPDLLGDVFEKRIRTGRRQGQDGQIVPIQVLPGCIEGLLPFRVHQRAHGIVECRRRIPARTGALYGRPYHGPLVKIAQRLFNQQRIAVCLDLFHPFDLDTFDLET